jgi:hypothetical protein
VDLNFESRRLQRLCNEEAAMTARWGKHRADLVGQCLQELDALDNLGDVAALPHVQVDLDPSGTITVSGHGGIRLVLRAGDHQGQESLDAHWEEIVSAVVVDVTVSGGNSRGGHRA